MKVKQLFEQHHIWHTSAFKGSGARSRNDALANSNKHHYSGSHSIHAIAKAHTAMLNHANPDDSQYYHHHEILNDEQHAARLKKVAAVNHENSIKLAHHNSGELHVWHHIDNGPKKKDGPNLPRETKEHHASFGTHEEAKAHAAKMNSTAPAGHSFHVVHNLEHHSNLADLDYERHRSHGLSGNKLVVRH